MIEKGRNRNRDEDGNGVGNKSGRDGGRDGGDDNNGAVTLSECGGDVAGGLPGGAYSRGIHMAGGGPDHQRGRVPTRHMNSGGGV